MLTNHSLIAGSEASTRRFPRSVGHWTVLSVPLPPRTGFTLQKRQQIPESRALASTPPKDLLGRRDTFLVTALEDSTP